MDYLTLWRTTCSVCLCLAIALYGPAPYVAQDVSLCSPRCWDPVQPNSGVWGGIYQGFTNPDECKALCVNNGTCIGVDWTSNVCWFQMPTANPVSYNDTNVIHWSLSNFTDDCVSYCWEAVKVDYHEGVGIPITAADENHCKLNCSTLSNCTGVDWNATSSSCWLIFNATIREPKTGIRHWDIIRNLPTHCQSSTSSTSKFTSNTVTTQSITTNSLENISRSTESLDGGISLTGCSNSLTIGIIVLAVLLGICLLIIIGLAINTVRIVRQLLQLKSDIKSIELKDNNYEGLQRAETKSEDATYTDLVQRNPNEAAHIYEQTS